ncbi:WXG100 family type VII secretion target [Nocardia brasiliensis]|uniref:ESAT-6-like protein n=1 Tax=Nocardia brasiliensis TaxID=37326 RepID=A0A6G9XWN8_NOCBR|nr:WXG100 family type VII secretion target [Nocardia brasiliensis]QIS05243.1 WXG100 family type VII secretion target [Nocardia brasiliensis]
MSSHFSVDLERLDQLVARLTGLSGFIHENLDGLDEKVAGLVGTGWESAAAQAYNDAHTQWARGAREFAEGVADMGRAARDAHSRYTRAVDLNHKMLSGG